MNSLAPEHLVDLRCSGLTDDTIVLMLCEGINPRELPIKGAVSGYSLPYFYADGTKNCFSRVKFVPEVILPDGRKMKYWKAKGSLPHLYCPPLLDWQIVAKYPRTELTITDGVYVSAA